MHPRLNSVNDKSFVFGVFIMNKIQNYWEDFSLEDRIGEAWLPILGYENLYHLSSLGRFKAIIKTVIAPNKKGFITRNPIIMKLKLSTNGYWHISLSKEGIRKTFLAHRLTAIHFVSKVEGKKRINHIDTVKHHGCASNLEWCTDSENQKHAYLNGLCRQDGEHHATKKLNWDKVNKIRSLYIDGRPAKELAEIYGINEGHVRNIVYNIFWKDKNYTWDTQKRKQTL